MTAFRTLAAVALAAALAVPAAAGDVAYYRAELAAPAPEAKVVAGGLLWACEGTSCTAAKDNSRPLIVCRKLAREADTIARFTTAGEEMSTEELGRCNA